MFSLIVSNIPHYGMVYCFNYYRAALFKSSEYQIIQLFLNFTRMSEE